MPDLYRLLTRGLSRPKSKPTLAVNDYLRFMSSFAFQGTNFTLPQTFSSWSSKEEGVHTLGDAAVGAYAGSGVVFACMAARMNVFSQIRYQFQAMRKGRPDNLFGTPALELLERPWPGGTTANLNTRMLVYGDLAGNAYITTSAQGNLRMLRPDWVTILAAGDGDAIDAVPVAYIYQPGGPGSGKDPVILLADEVAHFAPYPDPLANWIGMSWLTPVVRNIRAHQSASEHKLKFFDNGGTPNMIVKVDPSTAFEVFKEFKDTFREEYLGADNAYKTWFLGGGADATVVGSTMEQMTFEAVQGADETLIAAAAGVPLSMVGLGGAATSGSSLNSGNYDSAKRQFADTTIQHLAQEAAASLETLLPPPTGARLWFDTRDVAFFRDDAKAEAEIRWKDAVTLRNLLDAGWEADSAKAAVLAGDWSLLVHSGLFSVQLQPPGVEEPEPSIEENADV